MIYEKPSAAAFGESLTRVLGARNAQRQSAKVMVVLGSGGHTAEMFHLLSGVNRSYFSPRHYVAADSDRGSGVKMEAFEGDKKDVVLHRIPRSRKVGQSYFTSIFTTLFALWFAFLLVFKHRPDIIITNGPGTCIPLCFSVLLLNFFRILSCKIVYVESVARVKHLSLSGKIMSRFSDMFIVQWPELNKRNTVLRNYFFPLE